MSKGFKVVVMGNGHKAAGILHTQFWLLRQELYGKFRSRVANSSVRASTQGGFLGGPVVKTPCFYLIQQLDQFFLGELESHLPGSQRGRKKKKPKGFWTHYFLTITPHPRGKSQLWKSFVSEFFFSVLFRYHCLLE